MDSLILKDIPIPVDPEKLQRVMGKYGNSSKIHDLAKWACETVDQTAEPQAIFGVFQIESHGTDHLTVVSKDSKETVTLQTGCKGVEFAAGSSVALISFATLGNDVHSISMDFAKNGDMLKQYIFDTAATFALYHVGKAINTWAEDYASEHKWGVSRRLSPGDLADWSLDDQRKLGMLLPVEKIGIEIRESGLLYPLKSASSLVAMGPEHSATQVGTICAWCRNQKNCPVRMADLGEKASS